MRGAVPRLLGRDNRDVLATHVGLAYFRSEAGTTIALDELLTDLLQVIRPDHPSNLLVRASLVQWQRQASDNVATVLEDLFIDLFGVFRADHRNTHSDLAHS